MGASLLALGVVGAVGAARAGDREALPLVDRVRDLESRLAILESGRLPSGETLSDAFARLAPELPNASRPVVRELQARHVAALEVLADALDGFLHGHHSPRNWFRDAPAEVRIAWSELGVWLEAGDLGFRWPRQDPEVPVRSGFGSLLLTLPWRLSVLRQFEQSAPGKWEDYRERVARLREALMLLQWRECYETCRDLMIASDADVRALAGDGRR
jgi:hypothetical protein